MSTQLQYPGVWLSSSTENIDVQFRIARDLEQRQCAVRDADGYVRQIAQITQDSVRNWTDLVEEETLRSGQLGTYIMNCPKLHPLTSQVLSQFLESRDRGNAGEVR